METGERKSREIVRKEHADRLTSAKKREREPQPQPKSRTS